MNNPHKTIDDLIATLDAEPYGHRLHALIERLFPICRSITGAGNRETLAILREQVDLECHEVPSGTEVFDWVIPPEWTIRDAWIKDPQGRKIVDFQQCNLHVVGYSEPVRGRFPLEELQPHLHSLPDQPDLIPYRTSYYQRTWGFCLAHRHREALTPGTYEVCIDADLKPGHLTYGERLIPGASKREVLISTHLCHPSLANDNLSGISVAIHLIQLLQQIPLQYSYRFLFIPGTIGSITWLARHQQEQQDRRIAHGLVLSCLGDAGPLNYKQSRSGDAPIDRAVALALRDTGRPHAIHPFSPYGYDERQYCSPGFNLPVGLLTRSPHGTFPEYHTSADNLSFVQPEALCDSLRLLLRIVELLETDRSYFNCLPYCEPQLGKRGLYDTLGGANDRAQQQLALLWVLNQSDGFAALSAIARKSGLPYPLIRAAADRLVAAGLIEDPPDLTP